MVRNGVIWDVLELDPTEFADGIGLRCEQNPKIPSILSEQLEGWHLHY